MCWETPTRRRDRILRGMRSLETTVQHGLSGAGAGMFDPGGGPDIRPPMQYLQGWKSLLTRYRALSPGSLM
jgi:hypothetical protein